MFIIF